MPTSDSYIVAEKINPLSDEFYRRYGLFDLSVQDEFTFSPAVLYHSDGDKRASFTVSDVSKPTPPGTPEIDGRRKKVPIALAVFVRLVLIGHNALTAWRVAVAYNDDMYWLLAIANVLLIGEGLFTVITRGGMDYKWWCPCFLIYLASTLPSVWLLQLKQSEDAAGQSEAGDHEFTASTATDSSRAIAVSSTIASAVITTLANASTSALANVSATELVSEETTTVITKAGTPDSFASASTPNGSATVDVHSTTPGNNITTEESLTLPSAPDSEIWLIIVEEALIYLLVFCRWLLPRRNVSREFLADLLLEFLAIASDIMELLAVFDEPEVRSDRILTYWVMGVWSASFIQFIPVLAHKRMFRRLRSSQMQCFKRACGTYFVEIIYTFMSVFLQDGPFLALRLYIMIRLKLITYSLVFFVLKNIVTLILLFYRLGIMCYSLPCNKRKGKGRTVAEQEHEDYEENAISD